MERRIYLVTAIAVLAFACEVSEPESTELDDPADDGVTALEVESANRFNANPFKPTNGAVPYECIWPALGSAQSTAARFFGGQTAFYSWRSLDWSGTTCLPGQLRVARWERYTIAGQRAYIMRGGGGDNADEVFGSGGIRFGHVLASQLDKETSVLSRYIPGHVGEAPASCTGTLYTSNPARGTTPDLSALYYKPDQPSSSGAKWDNYGDQAGTGPTHYAYALWTWPVLPDGSLNAGGGQIRAVVTGGEHIRACDVAPVYLPMYPARSGTSAGRMKMMYGRIRNPDGAVVHGWFAIAWRFNGEGWHYFVD